MRGDARYQARDGDSEYLRLSSHIPTNVQFIFQNGRSIQRIANSIGTHKEPRNALQQVESLTHETKLKIQETQSMIAKLGRLDGGNANEAKQRKQAQSKFSKDLEGAITAFEKGVEITLTKEKAKRNDSYDDYGNENTSLIDDDRRQQEQMLAQDVNIRTSYIREREQGIMHLESEMREVHELFVDVADIVQEAGKTLVNIEANMTVASDRTSDGVEQLTKASRHQKSARKKSLWLLLIVVIAAGVLAAIIVPSLKHHK
eukprot:m.11685 g.11685  ORF g.11685 m.11685 type:complete len:259 (+) comp3870_c0_seq1:80-856(+)